jgi:glycosyltransferase involved in cell wall biosynthesis
MKVVFALRHLPSSSNSGGPISAAHILAKALAESGMLEAEGIHIEVLVNHRKLPLSSLIDKDTYQYSNAEAKIKTYWQLLEEHPNSYLLNVLHAVSLRVKSILLPKILQGSSSLTIVQSFIPNFTHVLARKARDYILVHYEHSKGGWSREFTQMYPQYKDSLLVRRMKSIEINVVRSADFTVFPSKGAYYLFKEWHSDLWDVPESKIGIVYTGIQDYKKRVTVDINGVPRFPRLILNIAQHVPEKRIDRFILGVQLFLGRDTYKHQGYVAVNYGTLTQLTNELKRIGGGNIVQFKGTLPHEELLQKIARSWVVVSVPEVAVFDLAILESMCFGKPIIASRVGGNIEALGIDYPLYADEPWEIAEKLNILANDDVFYQTVANRNRKRFVENFTQEVYASSFVSLWKRLLKEV